MTSTVKDVPARGDQWSLKAARGTFLALGTLGLFIWFDSFVIFLIASFVILGVLIGGAIGIVLALVQSRYRHATSLAVGLCLISLSVYAAPYAHQAISRYRLHARLPEFERTVKDYRSRVGAHDLVQIVVYFEDHSIGVASNSFEQVIFDEADTINGHPDALKGFWPYPESPTGVINVEWGRKSVTRLSGHFYDVWSADP